MFDKSHFINDCLAIREQSPLIHCITNYVAMESNANALLAIGASPIMSFYKEEMKELVQCCNALSINIGCLDERQIEAMKTAAASADSFSVPWVLDPVGVGVSRDRKDICSSLIKEFHPQVIRGNASEIMCLADMFSDNGSFAVDSRGVDSLCDISEAVEAAKMLARTTGAVISVSGSTDVITDGENVETIGNGNPLMSRITAMGCTATVITAAFLAVSESYFEAALHAMALMGTCGELAAEDAAALSRTARPGTGSLAVSFIDRLSVSDCRVLAEKIRN